MTKINIASLLIPLGFGKQTCFVCSKAKKQSTET